MKYDLIIIGMGISGISAAIYAKHSGLNILLIEKNTPGGLLNKINTINNYPGYSKISGPDLSLELFKSINDLNIPYKIAEVESISIKNDNKIISANIGEFESKYVIVATGRNNKKLGLSNEEKLLGRGISTCALCDGNLYKDKDIALVGGGNSAIEEAIYLSNIANKIYLIHRRSSFTAEKSLVEELLNKKNIEIFYDSNITEIIEDNNQVKEVVINNDKHLVVDALFKYIGFEPNNSIFKNLDISLENGYIVVDNHYETNVKGIYAVGDCIKKNIYQLITAANDGVVASISIIKKMEKNK